MEISLKDDAPGWLDEVNAWLWENKNVPNDIGFSVAKMHKKRVEVTDAFSIVRKITVRTLVRYGNSSLVENRQRSAVGFPSFRL